MGDGRVEAAAKALAERATGPGVMQDGWRIIGFTPWQIAEVMLAAADAVDDRDREITRLREERQAVIDCVNLYGDETLHAALDAIGFFLGERRQEQ